MPALREQLIRVAFDVELGGERVEQRRVDLEFAGDLKVEVLLRGAARRQGRRREQHRRGRLRGPVLVLPGGESAREVQRVDATLLVDRLRLLVDRSGPSHSVGQRVVVIGDELRQCPGPAGEDRRTPAAAAPSVRSSVPARWSRKNSRLLRAERSMSWSVHAFTARVTPACAASRPRRPRRRALRPPPRAGRRAPIRCRPLPERIVGSCGASGSCSTLVPFGKYHSPRFSAYRPPSPRGQTASGSRAVDEPYR